MLLEPTAVEPLRDPTPAGAGAPAEAVRPMLTTTPARLIGLDEAGPANPG